MSTDNTPRRPVSDSGSGAESTKTKPPLTKQQKRRRAWIIFAVVLAAMVLMMALNSLPYAKLARAVADFIDPPEETKPVKLVEPDFDLDITADAEYMAQKRYVTYTEGALTVKLDSASEAANYGLSSPAAFFADYFAALTSGDADALNACFDDGYYAYDGAQTWDRITPQRIYDISVVHQSSEDITEGDDAGCTVHTLKVTFSIMKNDGTFRSDIPSSTPYAEQYFLVESSSGTFIRFIGSTAHLPDSSGWNGVIGEER